MNYTTATELAAKYQHLIGTPANLPNQPIFKNIKADKISGGEYDVWFEVKSPYPSIGDSFFGLLRTYFKENGMDFPEWSAE